MTLSLLPEHVRDGRGGWVNAAGLTSAVDGLGGTAFGWHSVWVAQRLGGTASGWLARGKTHRGSLSGTHRPLDGPPNTFAHDASSRGPVVHADMRGESGVVDFAGRLRLSSGCSFRS